MGPKDCGSGEPHGKQKKIVLDSLRLSVAESVSYIRYLSLFRRSHSLAGIAAAGERAAAGSGFKLRRGSGSAGRRPTRPTSLLGAGALARLRWRLKWMFGAGAADSYSKMEGGGAGRGAAAAPAALNLGALGRGGNLTEARRKRLREVI